ncbi:MAG: hypothetical protein U0790_13075 [Isosphaeraceae bacterium]
MKLITRLLPQVGLCLTVVLLSGCGMGQTPHPADPEQARTTLNTVLDAWKSGATPESLEAQSPPIRVLDLDWKDGHTLVSYRPGGEARLVGFDLNYPVVLELKRRKGGTVKKTAVYTITTHPEILVLRQEG